MPPEHATEFRRLGRAVEVFLAFQDAGGGDVSALLAAHVDLRDLLEPMVVRVEEPATAAGPDGRFLAGFRLLREIGRGGMGIVYEAEEIALHRTVALKVLPAQFGIAPRQVERFRREAAAAARLRHPGIVPVFQVGEVDGTHYFAMELVDGRSLGQVLADLRQRCGDDPSTLLATGFCDRPGSYFGAVAEIVAQAAEAIAAAHEGGVLHRDLKPHNLLLARDGSVRVVDFGLAKDLEGKDISRSGEIAGTPHYMSPEQTLGGKHVDERTDIWSLGVVLYELLTLRTPFEAETSQAVLAAIAAREPAPPRRSNPRVPRDLETICRKAIEKDRRHRYPSAAAFAADLRRFVRHEPIVARPPGSVTRLMKLLRRRKAPAVAGVLAFLLLVVGPIAFSVYQRAVNTAMAQQQAEAVRQRDRARDNYARALRFVEQQMHRVEQFAREPGMELVHRQMAEDALRCYRDIEATDGDDPRLLVAALQTQVLVGRIHHHLGAHAEARRALDDVLQRAETPAGGSDEVRLVAAAARRHRAAVLRALGDRGAATADLAAARAAVEAVLAATSTPAVRRAAEVDLAALLVDGARYALEEGRDLAPCATNLAHAAALLRTAPRTREEVVLLVDALRVHCEACRATGQAAAGRPRLEEAASELAAVTAADAQDPLIRMAQAQVAAELGALLKELGETGPAAVEVREAVAMREALVRDFPRNQGHRHALEVCLTNLSQLLAVQGDPGWRATGERAVDLAAGLCAETPASLLFASRLCATINQLCLLRSDRDRDTAAVEAAFARALDVHREVVARFPDVPRLQSQLGAVASNHARFLTSARRWADARPLLHIAIQAQQAALAADASAAQYRRFLANHYMLLTTVETETGALDDGEVAARAMLPLVRGDAFNTAVAGKLLVAIASARRARATEPETARATAIEREAIAILQQAIALDHSGDVRGRVRRDPTLGPLRSYPEFIALLAQ